MSSGDFRKLYTLSDNDVLAVLNDIIKAITRHLTEGEIVKLGDFGNFQITLSSEGKRERERERESDGGGLQECPIQAIPKKDQSIIPDYFKSLSYLLSLDLSQKNIFH
ncbi:MAG: hypothetical protein EOO18_02565 [Chryseobacterium sp.]|nr:MAG: hypothetical protein EOO18_02565 [Chryseobacterium sp.]